MLEGNVGLGAGLTLRLDFITLKFVNEIRI